jgi:hypothetical protein
MAGSTTQKHLNSNCRLLVVCASPAAYVAFVGRSALEGDTMYDTTDNVLKSYNGASWVAQGSVGAIGFAGAVALDPAATSGITITCADALNTVPLTISQLDTSSANAVTIHNDSTGKSIEIHSDGAGAYDIAGTNGSSTVYWGVLAGGSASFDSVNLADDKNIVIGTDSDFVLHYDNTTRLQLDAASANNIFAIGSTTATDVVFHGTDATYDAHWDSSADTLGFLDNAILGFGNTAAAPDRTIKWNGTDLLIECATQDTGAIKLGSTNACDLYVYGATNTNYVQFNIDDSGKVVNFRNFAVAIGDGTSNFTFGPAATNAMPIDAGTANETINVGATTATDIVLHGTNAGYDIQFDSSRNALNFMDNSKLGFGASIASAAPDVTFSWDASNLLIEALSDNAGQIRIGSTNAIDLAIYGSTNTSIALFDVHTATLILTGWEQSIVGVDSQGTLLAVAGIDTSGNSDTVTITHQGTGSGLKITNGTATAVALTALACANQTTSLVVVDGATANWIGATNVGMLHMTADTAFAHANATMLYAASSATPIASSLGCIARFIDSGADSASSYAVCINSTHNGALNLTGGSDRVALNVAAGTVAFAGAMACTGIATFATGYQATAVSVKPAADSGAGSIIPLGTRMVTVAAVTTNANDWIILPPAATVGQEITILCAAGGNFELRTPVASSDLINNVDCSDGAAEYLCTDTDMIRLVNTAAAKWVATSYTYLGAVRTAVVPDA